MTKTEILNVLRVLSNSQGFYGRMYRTLSDNSEDSNNFLEKLENENFRDAVDLLTYLEQ
jgi:hypothetical protein